MNSAVVDGNWHFDNLWVSHHHNKKDLMMMRNKKNDEYHTGCGNLTWYEIATPIHMPKSGELATRISKPVASTEVTDWISFNCSVFEQPLRIERYWFSLKLDLYVILPTLERLCKSATITKKRNFMYNDIVNKCILLMCPVHNSCMGAVEAAILFMLDTSGDLIQGLDINWVLKENK